jgi:glycosyltransferase involved in cell wall biosynthesis
MNNPLVSVLMTSYNREQYIAEAIESVLGQTYQNWELIVVDDSSKDSTVCIATKYAQKDNRIRVYINESNLGDYPNRNRAASYARGEYMMFVDSDDSIEKGALTYIIKNFHFFPEANHSTITYDKNITVPCLMTSEHALREHLYKTNMLATGPGARVFKKNFYEQMGGYPILYGPANDNYFNIRTTAFSPILCLPYTYLNYRRHEGQEINNQFAYLYQGYLYFRDAMMIPELPISNEEKSFFLKKNKRRFVVNLLNYFAKERKFSRCAKAIRLADFSINDLFIAIFHY